MKNILLFWLFIPNLMMAAETEATAPSPRSSSLLGSSTLWEKLVEAGWVMIPLLAVSMLVVALVLYYLMTLRRGHVVTDGFRSSAEAMIREGNFAGLLDVARASPQLLARVVEKAAQFKQDHVEADFSAIREVAEAEGNRQAAALNQMVVYLMDIGVLAPMLGLLGTVVGILRAFGTIASEEATAMRTLFLAGGVSQALVATAAGLIVGITAMFFYSYFRGCAQRLISELEASATALIAQMGLKLKK